MDLYREELKVWKECQVDAETGEMRTEVDEERGSDIGEVVSGVLGNKSQKMPGAYEW